MVLQFNPASQTESPRQAFVANSRSAEYEELLCREILFSRSIFGRMVTIALLRQGGRGSPQPPWGEHLGEADRDRLLSMLHRRVFSHWLSLTVMEQNSDLEAYLGPAGFHPGLLSTLPELGAHVVPSDASPAESGMFLRHIRRVTMILARRNRLPARGAGVCLIA